MIGALVQYASMSESANVYICTTTHSHSQSHSHITTPVSAFMPYRQKDNFIWITNFTNTSAFVRWSCFDENLDLLSKDNFLVSVQLILA